MKISCYLLLLLSAICINKTVSSAYTGLKISSNFTAIEFPSSKADTVYRITAAYNGTYGYEILMSNKVFIRQLTIPGRPGNKGFATKEDAEKVAELVIQKIKKGLIPPTVSQQELKYLKISI